MTRTSHSACRLATCRFAQRSITAAALILVTLAPALASSHYETMYRDTIRPHGQPRSQRVYDAAMQLFGSFEHFRSAVAEAEGEVDLDAILPEPQRAADDDGTDGIPIETVEGEEPS